MNPLEQAILAAHAAADKRALARLYREAAEGAGSEDAQAFFLTQAWIFALDAGAADAPALAARLAAMGRL